METVFKIRRLKLGPDPPLLGSLALVALSSHGLQPARLLCPWDFPGKDAGVGCHSLLQGLFLTQGLNLRPLHCRRTLCPLSHQELAPFLAETKLFVYFCRAGHLAVS